MTDLDLRVLTASEARRLTDRIKSKVCELLPLIREAYQRHAWVGLGYADWHEYCDAELRGLRLPVDDRSAAAAELYDAGMSKRAIGAALGVDEKTIRNDLAGRAEYSARETVTDTLGRQQPANKPTPAPATPAGTCEACGTEMDVDQVKAGYMRCDECDSEGEHVSAIFPKGRDGSCVACADPDRHGTPVTTDQPVDRPAEAADPAPAAADGGDPPSPPSAPSPLETYLAGDRKLARTGWQKNFAGALARSIGIVRFTPEQVAEYADRELVDELRRLVTNLDDYATRAEKAWNGRNGGLRVLKGGAA